MSRFWPHAEHAEDQRFGKSILTVHALDRGMQAGTILGMDVAIALAVYRRWQQNKLKSSLPASAASRIGPTSSTFAAGGGIGGTTGISHTLRNFLATPAPFLRTVTNAAGLGAAGGLVIMAGVLPMYMRGKTHVEWQDRSWRLLASEGQVEVDDWSWVGAITGASTSFVPSLNKGGFTYLNFVGRGCVGAMAGVVGYMGWRYGVMGGKRKNDNKEKDKLLAGVPTPA